MSSIFYCTIQESQYTHSFARLSYFYPYQLYLFMLKCVLLRAFEYKTTFLIKKIGNKKRGYRNTLKVVIILLASLIILKT